MSFGSPAVGGTGHLAMEYFQSLAGFKVEHVVYRGSSLVLKDLLAGHIPSTMDNLPPYLPHIQSGALRALGVSSGKRWFSLPDVPTIAEQGFAGFDAAPWWYVAAPAGTPPEIVKKLSDELVKGVKSPDGHQEDPRRRRGRAAAVPRRTSPSTCRAEIREVEEGRRGRQAGAAMTPSTSSKGKIQTVLGPIEPEALGRTLMHEHVLCDIRPPATRSDNDLGPEITLENTWQINYGRGLKRAGRKYMLDLEDIATREVAMMKHEGGDAIVELSCGGLSPDPNGLRRIAAGTGVHLVMGCGYYVNDYQDPKNHDRTVDDFAAEMIGQILHGAWGTDVRAGMIGEIGCQAPWTDTEKRVMQARAHRRQRDRRRDQRPSRPRSRPAAGGRRLHQGGGLSDRAHRHQPHRPHHLRRAAPAEARRLRRHGRVRPVRPGVELLRPVATSTCPTMRRGSS